VNGDPWGHLDQRPNDVPPTCDFGQHGPRVNACDREAVDGSEFCEVHSG
jgi:hypothetical protein